MIFIFRELLIKKHLASSLCLCIRLDISKFFFFGSKYQQCMKNNDTHACICTRGKFNGQCYVISGMQLSADASELICHICRYAQLLALLYLQLHIAPASSILCSTLPSPCMWAMFSFTTSYLYLFI